MDEGLLPEDLSGTAILDPCAGRGGILRVLRGLGARTCGVEIDTGCDADLRPECTDGTVWCDALHADPWPPFPGLPVIANPPYSLAEAFVRAYGLDVARPFAAFLLRLGFLESKKRWPLFSEHPPAAVYVLSDRPSFTGNGRTDASAYAWATWSDVTRPGETRVRWLL